MSIEAMLMAAGAKNNGVNVVDAFSTTLYTGNGSSYRTISNGIDLTNEGGMVWIKNRSLSVTHHNVGDTLRGYKSLSTNLTDAESGMSSTYFTNYYTYGFQVGQYINTDGSNYASWTFRQAPKFFDVVRYTGDGVSGRQIAHDLGVAPGMIVVKRLDADGSNWKVWHRAAPNIGGHLNDTIAFSSNDSTFSDPFYQGYISGADDSVFTVTSTATSNWFQINQGNGTYIAYLFAHDPSEEGIIQCGSYTGNGSTTGPTITLGWEPQWLLVKAASAGASWFIWDNKRDNTNPRSVVLQPNLSSSEVDHANYNINFTASGFQMKTVRDNSNSSGVTYIYMAIRAPE